MDENKLMVDDILAELQTQIGDQACTIAILRAENRMLKNQLNKTKEAATDADTQPHE